MKKINRNHGFTMAELLIVVAIIAVLVAVSIPVFSNQLEKSREATDAANIRSAYAQVQAAVLLDTGNEIAGNSHAPDLVYTAAKDAAGKWTYTAKIKLKQQQDNWINEPDIGGVTVSSSGVASGSTIPLANKFAYIKYDGTNTTLYYAE